MMKFSANPLSCLATKSLKLGLLLFSLYFPLLNFIFKNDPLKIFEFYQFEKEKAKILNRNLVKKKTKLEEIFYEL